MYPAIFAICDITYVRNALTGFDPFSKLNYRSLALTQYDTINKPGIKKYRGSDCRE